jgi:hypothetical protein
MKQKLIDFPEGYFWQGKLWWGDTLNESTVLATGAQIDLPDMRTADNTALINLRFQLLYMLTCVTDNTALQTHWSVGDDYFADLERYDKVTHNTSPGMTRWCAGRRDNRSTFYRELINANRLRRERLYFYLAHRCSDLKGGELQGLDACKRYMTGAAATLTARFRMLEMSLPMANWEIFDDAGHYRHLSRFFNPSMDRSISAGEAFRSEEMDIERSVRANCVGSEFSPFTYGRGEGAGWGLQFDGLYHAIFVLTRQPLQTQPRMMLPLLNTNDRGCMITQNIYPMEVGSQLERLRKEIGDMRKNLTDSDAVGVDNMIRERLQRISALQSSIVQPFKTLTICRVWAEMPDKLHATALATKSALRKLNGMGVHEVNDPVQARHLFLETIPGNLGGEYRGWDRYMQNLNLVDLIPASSTFTGKLNEAEALLDSPSGGIVGIRLFSGSSKTPQPTMVTGQTGAGKSAAMIEILSQINHILDYEYIQEEGMAFAAYAMVRGLPSIALKESSNYTLNPFDTFGLPMTSRNIATVVKTGMKLRGISQDEDKNREVESFIAKYAGKIYRMNALSWKDRDENRWMELTRMTMLCEKIRQGNDDVIDGYIAYQALLKSEPDRAAEMLAVFSEKEIVDFQTGRQTSDLLLQMVYTRFLSNDEEFPLWSNLCNIMKPGGRDSSDKHGAVADELTKIATALAQGKRFGGTLGGLIDGQTNVSLFGKGLHFDTSYLPDGTLKEVAGFLFPDMVRKYIMTMPRSALKLMLIDELRRMLLIPGAAEFVKEMLAQLRKYRACFMGSFQTISQIKEIDPAVLSLLLSQCKQHLLFRQPDREEMERLAVRIGLPEPAQRSVLQHPLIEHQRGKKASYFTLFIPEGAGKNTVGTVRCEVDPQVLYVADSSGEIFDRKQETLRNYKDPTEGVYTEVEKLKQAAADAKQQHAVEVFAGIA